MHRCAQSNLAVALSDRVSRRPLRLDAHAVASAPDSAAAAFGRPIPGILRGEVCAHQRCALSVGTCSRRDLRRFDGVAAG